MKEEKTTVIHAHRARHAFMKLCQIGRDPDPHHVTQGTKVASPLRAGERTSRLSCFCKTYASISIMRFFAHAGVFFV